MELFLLVALACLSGMDHMAHGHQHHSSTLRASRWGAATITNLRANGVPTDNNNKNNNNIESNKDNTIVDEALVLPRSTQERRHLLLLAEWAPCTSSDECDTECCSNDRSIDGQFKCTPMENGFDSQFCIAPTSNIEEMESPQEEGTCGNGTKGNYICPDPSQCCSMYGFCGTTADHCAKGTCGDGDRGNGICPTPGDCCSPAGYCGTTPEYCDPPTNASGDDGNRSGVRGVLFGLFVVMVVVIVIVLIRGKYIKVTRYGKSCIVRWEWNDKSASSKMTGIGSEKGTSPRPDNRLNPQESIAEDSLYTTDSSSFNVNHKPLHGILGGVPPPDDSSSVGEPSLYSMVYPPKSDCMESSVMEYSVLNLTLPRVEEDKVDDDDDEQADSRPYDNRPGSDAHVFEDVVYEDIDLHARE